MRYVSGYLSSCRRGYLEKSGRSFHVGQRHACDDNLSWQRGSGCTYLSSPPSPQHEAMSWILNPEGDGGGRKVRQRPSKLANLPTGVDTGSAPATPTKAGLRTPGSVPGSPWAEFPNKDNYPKAQDPSDVQREVSTKQANRPFLAYVYITFSIAGDIVDFSVNLREVE